MLTFKNDLFLLSAEPVLEFYLIFGVKNRIFLADKVKLKLVFIHMIILIWLWVVHSKE
jgi:hypothetical protein